MLSGAPHPPLRCCKQSRHKVSFITTNSLMFARASECYLTTMTSIHLFVTATQRVL